MTGLRHPAPRQSTPLIAADARAEPSAVAQLRRAVTVFARAQGAGPTTLGSIRLAVSEAVANVVMHAYEPGEEGQVHLRAAAVNGNLQVIVYYEGHGIRTKPSQGQGLGLGLLAQISADLSIRRREPRGTEITMSFVLAD